MPGIGARQSFDAELLTVAVAAWSFQEATETAEQANQHRHLLNRLRFGLGHFLKHAIDHCLVPNWLWGRGRLGHLRLWRWRDCQRWILLFLGRRRLLRCGGWLFRRGSFAFGLLRLFGLLFFRRSRPRLGRFHTKSRSPRLMPDTGFRRDIAAMAKRTHRGLGERLTMLHRHRHPPAQTGDRGGR